MINEVLPIKVSERRFCPDCLKEKRRSKTFRTFRQLKHHVSYIHQNEVLHQEIEFIEENIQVRNVFDHAKKIGVIR